MQIEKTIILNQSEIRHIIICQLQESGHIHNNVLKDDISLECKDGEVKCTIKVTEER